MAAELVLAAASVVFSPYLQVFFERMASHEFDDFFRGRKLTDRLLKKLNTTLLSVTAVVEDAEDRQFSETNVKMWLDELKDVIYDAEDILDKTNTKALQYKCKLDSEFGTIASKVRHSISISHFVNKIEREIKAAIDRLEDLAKQIDVLGMRACVGGQPLERLPTTSFTEEYSIFGRDSDKEAIIKLLLSNDVSGNEIGVIAIANMGGIGKTTIAQLVYNDKRLKDHFDLRTWVCVSHPFDVFMVMKTILEAVTSSTCDKIKEIKEIKDLNQLQMKLQETLTGNKFLPVLDDVWYRNYAKWGVLSNAFKFKAQGSNVIVTTRDSKVARVMHARETHHIMELSKEDCWSLFVKYAFLHGNFDAYPELEAIGRKIVDKCKGLPLAIKSIGTLLWSKLDVDEWDKILRSELWDLSIEETGILLALRLSYKYLVRFKAMLCILLHIPKGLCFRKRYISLVVDGKRFLAATQKQNNGRSW